jgi:hypothetical protein
MSLFSSFPISVAVYSCRNHQIEDLRIGKPFSEIGSICIVPINECGGGLSSEARFFREENLPLSITLS